MKYVLVTGASSGIGYASVQFLLDKGYYLFGSVRKKEDAERLKQAFPTNFTPLVFDVTQSEEIATAFQQINEIVGTDGLSALVNNAGIAVAGPLEYIPMEKIRYQFEVNVLGLMEVTKTFLPLLGARENHQGAAGKIINISSVSGIFTSPFAGLYCASKFAVESFSDALRRELFIHGIDVVVIQPGPIKTPIWEKTQASTNLYQDTPYAPILKALAPRLRRSEKEALEVEAVAKRVYDALSLKRPKTRYIVAKNAFFLRHIIKLIPDRLLDRLVINGLKKWMDN